jgi:hypothetical protein
VFQFGSCSFLCRTAEFHRIHIEPKSEVVHDTRAGKTQRLTGEAFETSAQGEVLTVYLLHRQLPYCVLRGRKVPLIDTCLVRVIVLAAQGCQQGVELQELRILAGAHNLGKHFPRGMIDRMPQPPLGSFGTDKTPHFIYLGCASRRDSVVAVE